LYVLLTTLTIFMSVSTTTSLSPIQNLLNCFSHYSQSLNPFDIIYSPKNPSFSTILNMKIHNKRFKTATSRKPLAIITPKDGTHVQTTIKCAKINNFQLRIRSGGHDYEGFSYLSDVPYVLIDLLHLNSVDVNLQDETTWVGAGATLGKIYYAISKKNNSLAFPSGVCFSLGAGGHFSGGGYGNLMRKFGLSIDNIIEAMLMSMVISSIESRWEKIFFGL
jgi:hypothetical protein